MSPDPLPGHREGQKVEASFSYAEELQMTEPDPPTPRLHWLIGLVLLIALAAVAALVL
jgi:hypothetical protein